MLLKESGCDVCIQWECVLLKESGCDVCVL